MPIDPSIIANSMSTMASNMPDVNALMQQQMTGMQNINILERQRRADALELEDRALAAEERAAKEQEAATIKALLPAYTYGIQTGDIAGAGSLVPPEMRGQLQPFIDALTGQSPEQVRAALIGSLASSPEGEAALGAIQRAQTAEIQLGQLDVSRERLALDTEQAAAEKAGGGKVSFRETDAEGNVRMYDARGNEIGILPKAGKPATVAGGAAASESERIAGYNAGRALAAAKRIATAVQQDPSATAPGAGEAFVNLFVDPNLIRSEERQRVSAAQREMIDALLTLATGAAYNREQLEGQMESYIPRWTDAAGTRADKRAALLDLIESAKIKAGRAWTPDMDAQFSALVEGPLAGEAEGTTQKPRQISSDEEYDALPSGAEFLDPNGVLRRKP